MALFSQRTGITLEKAIQLESMDDELRIGLWNLLHLSFWDNHEVKQQLNPFTRHLWADFFKIRVDTCPDFYRHHPYGQMIECGFTACRNFFFGSTAAKWWEVYDFIEFVFNTFKLSDDNKILSIEWLNSVLTKENAAYRFVGSQLVPISDKNEIDTIEEALEGHHNAVAAHFQRVLSLLSDRQSPDYRNSIKESISAVESLCNTLTEGKKNKFSFSDALAELEKTCSFHTALKQAFLKLYGYTSDSGGIRHALTEDSEFPSYADAKFMLVTCSAFCNFLRAKMSEIPQ